MVRYETWLRPEPYRWTVWLDDQWDKIHSGLEWFENHPSALQERINLAHLALGSGIGYIDFRWPDENWRARFPQIDQWFGRLERRPSFSLTKPAAPPNS